MTLKTQFLIAWTFVKKYAWIVFAVAAAVFGFFLLRKSPIGVGETIDSINKQHDLEIQKIKEANAEHVAELQANQAKMEAALLLLDQKYRIAIGNLDANRRMEVDRIIQEHGDDPQALAEELAKLLNFKVE